MTQKKGVFGEERAAQTIRAPEYSAPIPDLLGYIPNSLKRLFTSLKWKSSEQSFASSPFLKCFATAGSGSGFLRHHFAVLPDVNWCAVGADEFFCCLAGTVQGAFRQRRPAP
jgi:hypothetical protein